MQTFPIITMTSLQEHIVWNSVLQTVQKSEAISFHCKRYDKMYDMLVIGIVVVLLFYVHGKHLRSCRDGQLT